MEIRKILKMLHSTGCLSHLNNYKQPWQLWFTGVKWHFFHSKHEYNVENLAVMTQVEKNITKKRKWKDHNFKPTE